MHVAEARQQLWVDCHLRGKTARFHGYDPQAQEFGEAGHPIARSHEGFDHLGVKLGHSARNHCVSFPTSAKSIGAIERGLGAADEVFEDVLGGANRLDKPHALAREPRRDILTLV